MSHSSRPCEKALARTRELGLFPERLDASPYAFDAEEEGQGIQRPGDDDFWADLHRAVVTGRAGILEETYLEGASRWHHLTSEPLAPVRAGLAPRARLAVWPPGYPEPALPHRFPCTRVNLCRCALRSCPTTTESYVPVGELSRRRATATGHSVSPKGEPSRR